MKALLKKGRSVGREGLARKQCSWFPRPWTDEVLNLVWVEGASRQRSGRAERRLIGELSIIFILW